MIARTARMLGFNVLFPIGFDRNGIGVERYTEKKFDISMHATPRDKFLEYCRKAFDELEEEMVHIMKMLGISGDFENRYRTDSEEYRKLTQATFIEMWRKGLVYEDTRPNNYCIDCRTTIADAEIVYEDRPTTLYYITFKVVETGEDIIIATTRPELICACQIVLTNPEDERYRKFVGKHATLPLYNRTVEIRAHSIVKSDFGSGTEMVCSYGDYNDVRLFRELKLAEIIAIDEQGRMTKNAGKYAGMRVKEARARIVEDLENEKLVVKKEDILHRTPTCERSKTPIEIIPMKDFYLKQLDFLNDVRKLANELKFHPEEHRQMLMDWINSVSIDWPISRRRFYSTEIPIWYCKDCRTPHVPEPGKYHQPWKEKAPFRKCNNCGSTDFVGEERTFDTWMDSSVSPLFNSKYLVDKDFFGKTYPMTIRPQGRDIVRTWLYYSLLRCHQITGVSPFRHAWVMGYVVDEKGQKMSKSKGNVIDPLPIVERHGSDIFRFWSAQEASLGSNFKVSEERIMKVGNFITKLWNVARYISMFPNPEKADTTETDKWILCELGKLIETCMKGYEDFDFFIPSNAIREFVWNVFAPHYIEMAKPRAYGQDSSEAEQKAAWFTLHTCLRSLLALLEPIIPVMTDYVFRQVYDERGIRTETFPEPEWKFGLEKMTAKLIELNSTVWNEKKKKGLSLKDKFEFAVPEELKPFEKDLRAMHNLG